MKYSEHMRLCIVAVAFFFSFFNAGAEERTICKVRHESAEIGVDGYEKIVFNKVDGSWTAGEVYVQIGDEWVKAADNALFSEGDGSQPGISPEIVSVSSDNRNALRVEGVGFTARFSVERGSPFIDRDFSFSPSWGNVNERDICFIFGFEGCVRERGFIGSYCEKDTTAYLFSPFPALYSRLEMTDGSALAFTQAIDYYGSSPVFRKAQRLYDKALRRSDIGVFSCRTSLMDGSFSYHDRFMLSDGSDIDFYDQLALIRSAFSQMYPTDHKAVAGKSRLTVNDYSTIASGLENELLDDRAQGPAGAMRPYAYSDFGGESFIGLNIYRSMIKYAEATGNASLYDFCLDKARMFVDKNDTWIENAYGFGDFFRYARGVDHYFDRDDSEVSGSRLAIGTFKGFERVDALGEVAMFADDADLKEGFLRLARVIHEKMVMPDFCQPVCYTLPELEPFVGTRDGGSAGGAALWADIMLMASQMTEGDESSAFLADAVASAKRAAEIGFQQMWSILDAPKSVAVSRTVYTLVELWKKTGDRSLLDSAAKVVNGLYHFYHYFNQTYSPFCTGGMSGACSIEKQEAAYESMLAIWQVAPLLDYVDDFQLLDLFVQARNSGYYFYPVNSQGLGTVHSIYRTYYEWPEAQYVPYEFASGILNDPSVYFCTVNLVQSIFRETKEIYGAGETFAFDLLFDGKAFSVCPEVCCICTSANLRDDDTGEERFVIYNSGDRAVDAPVIFRNLKYDCCDIWVDNRLQRRGVSAGQLENGIVLHCRPMSVSRLSLRPASAQADKKASRVRLLDAESSASSGILSLSVKPLKEASFYKLSVSRSPLFNSLNTKVLYSTDGVFSAVVDGMETACFRAEAFNSEGCKVGNVDSSVRLPGMHIAAQDDFARKGLLSDRKEDMGWTEINTDLRSDGSRAVMNILAEDVGWGVSEIQKTFDVECTESTRFEMVPYALPDQCSLSVFLEIDGKEYVVADRLRTLDAPLISFPLGSISGKKEMKVRIRTEGYVRGCILECVRFVSDSSNAEDMDIDFLCRDPYAASLRYGTSSGVLHIENPQGNVASLTFGFDADLSRNRNLVIDVENFAGMNEGAEWKLFLKDTESGGLLEIRNVYEIDGYDPESPYESLRKRSSPKYFRSKSGVYMYDVHDMFKACGMHHYELVLAVSGSCSLDIPMLYLSSSNAQVPISGRI